MILALDYGEKRIGVAVTDESERFVKAIDYISNNSEVKKIRKKDFPKGTIEQEIKDFKKKLKQESKIEFRKVCNKLLHLINIYYPQKIIIGLPTVPNQKTGQPTKGLQAKKVEQFIKKFKACLSQNKVLIEIEFIEESMTSQIAEQNLREQGVPSSKINEKVDSESARILLEEYISNKKNK